MSQKSITKIAPKTHPQAWHPEHTGTAGWVSGLLQAWDITVSGFYLHPIPPAWPQTTVFSGTSSSHLRVRISSDRNTLSFAPRPGFLMVLLPGGLLLTPMRMQEGGTQVSGGGA